MVAPKPWLKVWEKDPLFESNTETMPFISTTIQGHLATRAVLTNDMKLLKDCLEDVKNISCLEIERSLVNTTTATDYAMLTGNIKALEILAQDLKDPKYEVCLFTLFACFILKSRFISDKSTSTTKHVENF